MAISFVTILRLIRKMNDRSTLDFPLLVWLRNQQHVVEDTYACVFGVGPLAFRIWSGPGRRAGSLWHGERYWHMSFREQRATSKLKGLNLGERMLQKRACNMRFYVNKQLQTHQTRPFLFQLFEVHVIENFKVSMKRECTISLPLTKHLLLGSKCCRFWKCGGRQW
jgi:hypothetical protein